MMMSPFMRRILHVCLVLLSLSMLAGCEEEPVLAPSQSLSFWPMSGRAGTEVVIQGNDLTPLPEDLTVRFGTVPATVLSAGPSWIAVRVPDGLSPGKVPVSVNLLTAADSFMIKTPLPPPEHIRFAPSSGPIGARVVIMGGEFGWSAGDVTVRFGEVIAPVISIRAEEVVVRVPEGIPLENVPVSVEMGGATTTAADSFLVAVFNPTQVMVEFSSVAVMTEYSRYLRLPGQPEENWSSTGPGVDTYMLMLFKAMVDGCNGETRGDTIRFCHRSSIASSAVNSLVTASGTIIVDTARKVLSSMTYTYEENSQEENTHEGRSVSWDAHDLPYRAYSDGTVVVELRGADIPGHFLNYTTDRSERFDDTITHTGSRYLVTSLLPCPDSAYVRITLKP